MRRDGLLATLATAACAFAWLASATGALADIASPPPYDGGMGFPVIHDPSGPEEFSWEVELSGNQELQQVDERHAEVIYGVSEVTAFDITAEDAHDANGAEVPTTLVVSEGNVITLVVHHRAGNPLTGEPFVYPVVSGSGFERGSESSTFWVDMPPPDPPAEPPEGEAAPKAPRKGEIGGPPAFRLGPPDEGVRTSPELVFGTGRTIGGPVQLVAYGWEAWDSSPGDFCVWIEHVRRREKESGTCGIALSQEGSSPIAIDLEAQIVGSKPARATIVGGRISPDVAAVRIYFHRAGSRKRHHLDAVVGQVSGDLQQRLKQPAPFGFFYAKVHGQARFRALYAQALDADRHVIGKAHGLTGQTSG